MLSGSDVFNREYNDFIVGRVKSKVLADIVPPVEVTKRRAERAAGRWVNKSGISIGDRRPNYFRSLANYGDIFFETTMGSHREFKPIKGKRFGKIGSFVIVWDVDRSMSHGVHPTCPNVRYMYFYNSLAAVYALVEEAQYRGDKVTFLAMPQVIDDAIPGHGDIANRRAPVIPSDYQQPFPTEIEIAPNGEYKLSNRPARVKRLCNDVFVDREEMWGGHHTPRVPPSDGLLTQQFKLESVYKTVSGAMHSHDAGNLSRWYFWLNSTDYEGILNELLDFKFKPHGYASIFMEAIVPIAQLLRKMALRQKGPMIFITALPHWEWFYPAYHYFALYTKFFYMVIVDVGDHNWSQVFKREPTLQVKGKPIFTYIHINSLATIEVSSRGFNTFQSLDVTVEKDFGPPLTTTVTVSLDDAGGPITKSYTSEDYTTVENLANAINRDFPQLTVKRLTTASYPTKNINEDTFTLGFPNGVLHLSGEDLPNLTYKILKAIGGSMGGIKVR